MIVYCIECNITGQKYYGSTKQTLHDRVNRHKCNYDCCSKQIIERGNYKTYVVDEYDTKEEAELKEDWYIKNTECINQKRVCLSREERLQISKNYYYNNKEVMIENLKVNYQEKKEQKKEYSKQYYQKNKEEISEKNKQKIECNFCKLVVRKRDIKRHQKSKRCLEYQ